MQNIKYRKIIALGDSITNGCFDDRAIGWFGRLSEKLVKHYPTRVGFNNLAMDGDRTIDVYHRLCAEALTRKPDILFIACGVNDLTRWQSPSAPMDFSRTLRKEMWMNLLKTATDNIKQVYVLSILPVDEKVFPQPGEYDEPLYIKNEDIIAYNEEIKRWCADFDVVFLDTHSLFMQENLEEVLLDGVHPLTKGHEIIADFVYDQTKTSIEKTAYDTQSDIIWSLKTQDGLHTIYGIANYARGAAGLSNKAIFFVHGLTSHKNEFLHKVAAKRFCALGYDVYRFDLYSHEDDARRLRDCTLELHAMDVRTVLDHYASAYKNVYIVGHSYGGPSTMTAQPENIRAISLWDPSFNLINFMENQALERISEDMYMVNWNIQFLISRRMVEEAQKYDTQSCLALSQSLADTPIQVIHPRNGLYINDTVSWHSAGNPNNERMIIEGAGHVFDENDTISDLIRVTDEWFRRFYTQDGIK
ncbi:MAG: alpha/beta fold hydrolase [Alphaproteobacteria bacterium]|nr:alpha/beta fold hydrolase [Alphaproteobacteria bacterium]